MKKIHLFAFALASVWFGLCGAAAAFENAIKQIQVRHEGDQVLLKVQMASPLKSLPGNWSVVEPPRVVFDFPETENQSGQAAQKVVVGDLKSLNLVQTEKLTRLVLNLYRPTKFSTEIVGDVLFIKLQTQTVATGQEAAPSIYQPVAPKLATFAANNAVVRDVTFRRGSEGEAVILVDLTDGSVPVDVRKSGNMLSVKLRGVELPERLQNRRDVTDFSTPVQTISSRAEGDLTLIDIQVGAQAHGRWFHQAHVSNNQLTIEVKPLPVDDANKLVQSGQEGQKVSINFYNAEAAMVLRTLAEMSGKNVIIDSSLNGRTVTANLENVPYDLALEIILTQINAGMRVKPELVKFGDRSLLQQQEMQTAEEKARRDETAPLVSETFELNYAKAVEVRDLLLLGDSGGANARREISGGQSAGGDHVTQYAGQAASQEGGGSYNGTASGTIKSGIAAEKTGRLTGVLSSRGSLNVHVPSNKLFITDIAEVVDRVRLILREIDLAPKQVMIEARIVEASTGFSTALGVRLKYFGNAVTSLGGGVKASLGTASSGGFSNVNAFGAPATPSLIRTTTQGFGTNFTANGTTAINLMLFNNAATRLLSLELLAAEADDKNKTVSAPRVVTQNRKSAKINNTQQVTLLVGVNAQTGLPIYQTYSAPLTLDVTPSITPDNKISMELKIEKGTITNVTTGSLDTNTLNTNVIVENGGTVVIGGFARDNDISSEERVPVLGDLPYVGFLFKAKTRQQNRSELLIFVTPRIVTDSLAQR